MRASDFYIGFVESIRMRASNPKNEFYGLKETTSKRSWHASWHVHDHYPLRSPFISTLITFHSFQWAVITHPCPSILGLCPNIMACYMAESKNMNSLVTRRCGSKFKSIIFKLIIQKASLDTCHEIALRWMPWNCTNEKSTLVPVTAWCGQAPNHYLGQYWPSYVAKWRC